MTTTSHRGRLRIVGLGPGDPELMTLKAVRVIGEADVVAYHAGTRTTSHARRIAAAHLPADVVEEELRYPVTTGTTGHPGGYTGALSDFYAEATTRLEAHLAAGRDVVLLAEGDPMFYGSAMYLHDRLSPRHPCEVVPGVPAFAAATGAAGTPLARQQDSLTVLPGTLPGPELARRLAETDAAVIMKLGRTFPAVREALREAGRLDHAVYVEHASTARERCVPVAEVEAETVPYFSLILVPGDSVHRDAVRMRQQAAPSRVESGVASGAAVRAAGGVVHVLGLGPGPERWLTPEASRVLAEVEHVVGYGPYVARVPPRPGLQRHSSGNTVELDRARHALELARDGARVAVVSGGDAGVFGMATAVFEAASRDADLAAVEVQVSPGVSAVQAVAARAGAPIGGDFAVMSLSDRLKPWSVIQRRLAAAAATDLVVALYNPASRSRRTQVARARETILAHRTPDTVVVVGRDIGRAGEALEVTTLGELDPDTIDMRCLLIIGSSATRLDPTGRVWTPRSVPAATETDQEPVA